MIRFVLSLFVSFSISSCTIVKVYGSGDEPSYNFSFVSRVSPSAPVYISSTTYGAHVDSEKFILGYGSSWQVVIPNPEDCSIIVVVEKAGELKGVLDLLGSSGNDLDEICVLGEE